MLPMTVHGIVPKMPCIIMMQKVGMVRNFARSRISSMSAESHLQRCRPACSVGFFKDSFTGGSFKNLASSAPTRIAISPMIPKATRQPLRPMMVFLDMLPTIMVDRNIPSNNELCTRPKTLPRLPSEVTSAMMPLEMGLSAASNPPTMALSTIMLQRAVVAARAMVMTPCPIAPITMIDLRRKTRRSARMPHNGAARLIHTPWATVK
mmetsp:Transcript_16789/g.35044  ORF Transcript_16789/g.35044 Transcript_16789/m.35044 type:complete len:207 (-) Transcript_16789:292-912(-)